MIDKETAENLILTQLRSEVVFFDPAKMIANDNGGGYKARILLCDYVDDRNKPLQAEGATYEDAIVNLYHVVKKYLAQEHAPVLLGRIMAARTAEGLAGFRKIARMDQTGELHVGVYEVKRTNNVKRMA